MTDSSGTTTYAYHAENQLTSVTAGGTTTASTYNGDGLRVTKNAGGTTTAFAWDVGTAPNLLADSPTSEYVDGLSLVAQITTTTPRGGTPTPSAVYALDDVQQSIGQVTDASGASVGTTAYDAWGNVQSQSGTQLRLGYSGEQMDAESGLVYLRARYYDPATGRFLIPDPLRCGPSIYSYAGSNPINVTDPTVMFNFYYANFVLADPETVV